MGQPRYPSPETLKKMILDLDEPVLFKGMINNNSDLQCNWSVLTMNNLVKLIGDMPLPFRMGSNLKIFEPQWDIDCPIKTMTITEFLELTSSENIEKNDNQNKWYYFDYKYMHEWFKSIPEILKAIDWRLFGFEKFGDDSTLWIGSKGAHTNCHQDSYGCNLIAQLHGSKEWLLFPPEAGNDLKQTRVPYEESTIYSKLNFFCPSKVDEGEIMKVSRAPKVIRLEPSDVLFVPKGWWHYVESLDTSISVNVWLPVDNDNEARLKEALVKFIMTGLGEGLPAAAVDDGDEQFNSLKNSVLVIKECVKQCHKSLESRSTKEKEAAVQAHERLSSNLIKNFPDVVKRIGDFSKEEFKKWVVSKRERFPAENKIDNRHSEKRTLSEIDETTAILKSVVDTLCRSDVVEKIAEVLITEN